MNRIIILLLLGVVLSGCGSVSDTRPEVLRKSEYYLEHGVTAYGNSDYATATDFFTKALAHYRSIDDTHGMLQSLINLAETAMATGNARAALQHLDQAEQAAQRSEPPRYLDRLRMMRAQLYWREREQEKVEPLLQPLLPHFADDDQPLATPSLLQLTAVILRTDIAFSQINENPAETERWLRRLEASLERHDGTTPLHAARLSRFKATLKQRENAFSAALELLNEALEQYRSAAHRPAIAATLSEMARLQMAQQQWLLAEDTLQRALYIRLWIMDRIGSREVLYLLDAIYTQLGETEKALQVRQQAESITLDEGTIGRLQRKLQP
ncbi:MAG: hypothetical protein OQK96_12245 [Gammaproteobacteria bacterium]|nr:hypothetical protein [Gammaproteobacteria bacterium]